MVKNRFVIYKDGDSVPMIGADDPNRLKITFELCKKYFKKLELKDLRTGTVILTYSKEEK